MQGWPTDLQVPRKGGWVQPDEVEGLTGTEQDPWLSHEDRRRFRERDPQLTDRADSRVVPIELNDLSQAAPSLVQQVKNDFTLTPLPLRSARYQGFLVSVRATDKTA